MTQHDYDALDTPITGESEPPSRWHDVGLLAVLALFFGMAAIFGGT